MTAPSPPLRLPRLDRSPDDPKYVLLRVSGVEGGQLLDLALVGTDSSEVFAYTLKHSRASKLKAKKTTTSQEEWETILAALLLGVVAGENEFLNGVEAVAEVGAGTSMTIIIQRLVEGITQRLGEIVLPYTEEQDVDLFEWTGASIESNGALKNEIKASQTSLQAKDEQIRKLEEALSELSILKNSNEAVLIEKFSHLLNEKKMKVRELQTVLASANINTGDAEDMEVDGAAAGPSRARKRKAVVEDDSDEDNGAVKMDIDEPEREPEPDSDEADQQTASEAESDSDTMASSSISKPAPLTKGKAISPAPPTLAPISPPRRKTRGASAQPEKKPIEEELPPPRPLPFQSKAAPKKAPPPPPPVLEGSETESDGDDEL